ncbi:MAG: hemerythrin domain-containing protein [Syntrophales bacterium]
MKPIGPLMWEHRLIEKMVQLLKSEIGRIGERNAVNILLINQAVDFFRMYADRTHHGKEEDILFRDLAKKSLSEAHGRIMNDLIEEHRQARKMVTKLVDSKNAYLEGGDSLASISDCLRDLVEFYPKHIEKEDKQFFFPCLDYFSKDEQDAMLREFQEFDRQMIHEKYTRLVEEFLGQTVARPPRK